MLTNYLTIAWRNIRRQIGFSLINISGLAIGMTCCILILFYIQDEFNFDRYAPEAEHIYRLALKANTADRGELNTARTPPPWAPALAKDYPEVESYVRIKTPMVSWMISYDQQQKRFHEKGFYFADSTVFDFFGFNLLRGDPKTALAAPGAVVITESMARKYFGDEEPMNKIIRADNTYDFCVTGVMEDFPKNSHFRCGFLASFQTLTTYPIYGDTNYANFQQTGLFPDLYTYLRFQNDFPVAEFENKIPAFLNKYVGLQLLQGNITLKPFLQKLTDIHLHSHLDAEIQANSDINYIYIFSAIALFILIIACINFMNLTAARSANRAQEVGMRKVLGAQRIHLIGQFLGESTLLTLVALCITLIIVQFAMPLFNALSGKTITFVFDKWILFGMLGLVIFVGIFSGSYPALFLSSFRPVDVMKSSSTYSSKKSALRKILVVFQFTVSVIFIIGTGIVYNQLQFIQNKNLGFSKEQVIVVPLGDPRARQIYPAFKEQLLQSPDILSVSAASSVPGGLINVLMFQPEGAPPNQTVTTEHIIADHEFLNTLNIELKAGRNFSVSFPTDTMTAFIINEKLAQQLGWENSPLDKQINIGNFKRGRVIGLVKNFHLKTLHQKIEPLIIHLAPNADAYLYLAIKIDTKNIGSALKFINDKWSQIYPQDPFIYSFLDEDLENLYRTEELRGQIFIVFSVLAIFIACLGLLGLASFTATQRTKEIGVRKVLGASIGNVVLHLSIDFIKWVLMANIIAWPIAYFMMNNWLNSFAYRTHIHILTFVISGLISLVIALLTVSYQSLRAAMTNPAKALKYE